MRTKLTVFGANHDRSIGVHFDTSVRHRRGASGGEIFAAAVARMAAFLSRDNAEALEELCYFEQEGGLTPGDA